MQTVEDKRMQRELIAPGFFKVCKTNHYQDRYSILSSVSCPSDWTRESLKHNQRSQGLFSSYLTPDGELSNMAACWGTRHMIQSKQPADAEAHYVLQGGIVPCKVIDTSWTFSNATSYFNVFFCCFFYLFLGGETRESKKGFNKIDQHKVVQSCNVEARGSIIFNIFSVVRLWRPWRFVRALFYKVGATGVR